MVPIRTTVLAALGLAMALILGACAEGQDTAAPTPSPPPPRQYTRVTPPQGGISFEVPADWPRDGEAPVWRPAAGDPRRLSVSVVAPAPSPDPRAALPVAAAAIASQAKRDLGWAAATEFRLRLEAPPAEETHVVVVMGTRALFDFAITVPAGADQGPLQEALDHLLESAVLGSPPPSPPPGAATPAQ